MVPAQSVQAQDTLSFDTGTYEGGLRRGLRHGEGTYLWPNGAQYSGRWRFDLMHGNGTMKYGNGASYAGEWRDGRMHGEGVFVWPNGDKYTGSYVNGLKEGNGKLVMAEGGNYEGQWERNQPSGEGRYQWADGTVYVGQWKNNFPNGSGMKFFTDGRAESGLWEDGILKPCACPAMFQPVSEAFSKADAVFIGVVTNIERVSKDVYFAQFEVLKYWKGELLPGRVAVLQAGFTECDFMYIQDRTYLIYANQSTENRSVLITNRCSRSSDLLDVRSDIELLDKEVPCIDKNNTRSKNPVVGNDAVCGCDGQTYRNPEMAKRNGVQSWEIGACKEGN